MSEMKETKDVPKKTLKILNGKHWLIQVLYFALADIGWTIPATIGVYFYDRDSFTWGTVFVGLLIGTLFNSLVFIEWRYFIRPIQSMYKWQKEFATILSSKFIAVTTHEHTRGLAFAVDRMLKNVSQSRIDQRNEIIKAEEIVSLIASRLSPDSTVQVNIEKEKDKFEDVTRRLRLFPNRMRFTDIRSPSHWDLDNNLHNFTMAVIESLLGRDGNEKKKYIVTKITSEAIKKCINNFDNLLWLSHFRALAHCRQWIGCKHLNNDLEGSDQKKKIARALFHGHHDPEERDTIVEEIKELLHNSDKTCRDCSDKGICKKRVDFSIAKSLSSEDLALKSIFDKSELNRPDLVYWTEKQANNIIDVLHQHDAILNLEIKGLETNDIFDCCRFLFWKKEYLNDEEAQLRLWDNLLGVPMFWFDIDGSIFNSNDNTKRLKDYFISKGSDYIFLRKTFHDLVAYETKVQKDGISASEELTNLEQLNELLNNCKEILEILKNMNEEESEKPLLASHARFLYMNYNL